MSRVQNKASEADAVSWVEVLDGAISIKILVDFHSNLQGRTRTSSKTKIRKYRE
jgi:hypothetical protein